MPPLGNAYNDAESKIFLEADGVWVPLQVRGRAAAEKAQPHSFEVKAMVAYSGKDGRPGRRRRDRVVFDAVTRPDSFWRQGVAAMAEKFELDKVEEVALGVAAAIGFLKGIPAGKANASLRQAIDYLRRFEDSIDPHGPSMGTMESTNAHVIGSRMKSVGGAWSAAGGNAMARARAHVANGRRLLRPSVGQHHVRGQQDTCEVGQSR